MMLHKLITIFQRELSCKKEDLGLNQSFIELGGTSLSALAVSSSCLRNGIDLPVHLILLSKSLQDLFENASEISRGSDVTLEQNVNANDVGGDVEQEPPLTLASKTRSQNGWTTMQGSKRRKLDLNVLTEVSLTSTQVSFIEGSLQCFGLNIIYFYDTYVPEHIPALKRAWEQVLLYEGLVPLVTEFEGGKLKAYTPTYNILEWIDISVDGNAEYETELRRFHGSNRIPSCFKVITRLVNGSPIASTIVWQVHHALIDGYSMSILYEKIHKVANGCSIKAGPSFRLAVMEFNITEASQRSFHETFQGPNSAKYRLAASEIPFVKPAENFAQPAETGARLPLTIQRNSLLNLARTIGVTISAIHYGIWGLVLSKMTDSNFVTFGAVVSGRASLSVSTRDAVGPMIKILPFHVATNNLMNLNEFMVNIFRDLVAIESVQAPKHYNELSRVFGSALALSPDFSAPTYTKFMPLQKPSFNYTTTIPINILIEPDGGADLMYDCRRMTSKQAKTLTQYYKAFADAILSPGLSLLAVQNSIAGPFLDEILHLSNALPLKDMHAMISDDLVTLFEKASRNYPTLIAVEKGDSQITYEELDKSASQVAGLLSTHIVTGDAVCVHADRSINFIASIYAVLKSGGIYVPLDPALPKSMRESYYHSVSAKAYLAPRDIGLYFKPSKCEVFFSVESLLREEPMKSTLEHRKIVQTDASAYICFTSGSTGTPKPVLCHHRGVVAFQMDEKVRLYAKPGQRISQVMSPAFDGSIHEIFSATSYGATLVLPIEDTGFEHISKVDSAILTPTLGKLLNPCDFPALKYVYFVGEYLPQSVSDNWTAQKTVYNMYGPTETTCGATIKWLQHNMPVTIGKPTPFCRVYILDRNRTMSPPECEGDIYIAGTQVSSGYVGRPMETAHTFVADPIVRKNEIMYKTGDRGFWDENGEIKYVGRNDRQIKLGGFRLDLNSIEESMVHRIQEVTAAALFPNDNYLVAAVQPSGLNPDELKCLLASFMPPYAIPKYIYSMNTFPMTQAGKIDYKNLASIHVSNDLEFLKTDTEEAETKIKNAWRDILKLEDVALVPSSNFLHLGGHSLAQITLASHLSVLFETKIPLRVVIRNPELCSLVCAVMSLVNSDQPRNPVTEKPRALGKANVSPIEFEWLQKYQLGGVTSSFNVVLLYRMNSETANSQNLRRAWNIVLKRHRVLSSRFITVPSGFQRDYHRVPPRVRKIRFLNVTQQINRSFQISRDHLFQVFMTQKQLLICASHVVCDLTTIKILIKEVKDIIQNQELSPVQRSYADVTHWSTKADVESLKYWSSLLANRSKNMIRFMNGTTSLRQGYDGTSTITHMGHVQSRRLSEYTSCSGITFHQLMLATVALSCSHDIDKVDIVLGSPHLNRKPEDTSTVGLFVEPLPIHIRHVNISSDCTTESLLREVQRSSQSALAHAVPWNQLTSCLKIEDPTQNQTLFDIMVTFHDDRDDDVLNSLGLTRQHIWPEGSKFPLLCEFTATANDNIFIRIEYDHRFFELPSIVLLRAFIVASLDLLISDASFSEAKKRFSMIDKTELEE